MKYCLLLILMYFPLNVYSFDQIRNGPFVSLGVGVNIHQSNLNLLDNTTAPFQDAGSSFQFRMGSGALKRLSVFSMLNQRNYFSQEEQGGYFITDIGLGAQYYFTSYIRTAYLIGSAATAVSKFKDENVNIGKTFQLGGGYEVVGNWQLELSWVGTNSTINHTLYNQLDSQSVQLTINYIWY